MHDTKQSSASTSAVTPRQRKKPGQGRQSSLEQPQEKYPPTRKMTVRKDGGEAEDAGKEAQEYGDEKTASEIRRSIGPSS